MDTSFYNLLSIYDRMYLMTSVYLFTIPSLCQDMIGTYYVVSPCGSPSGSYKTGGLNHQHPGIVFGKVPGHGPPLYKIQISYKTCGMSNITVSEVNSDFLCGGGRGIKIQLEGHS